MKKQIITFLLGLFSAAATISSSFAQTTAMLPLHSFDDEAAFEYRVSRSNNTPANNALPLNAVSSKVIRSFERFFKEVPDPEWYAIEGNKYLSTFTNNDGRTTRALFGKDGYMYYAISYGNEQSLSKDERRLIKSNYVDYTIGCVFEVRIDDKMVWIVNLQDDDNLVIARVTTDGTLDELAHYQRHFPKKK